MRRFAAVLLILTLILPGFAFGADEPVLIGYSARSSQAEREWESKFRAIPNPANLREDMTVDTCARPALTPNLLQSKVSYG